MASLSLIDPVCQQRVAGGRSPGKRTRREGNEEFTAEIAEDAESRGESKGMGGYGKIRGWEQWREVDPDFGQ